MLIAEKNLREVLTPLQKNVLALLHNLCCADVVITGEPTQIEIYLVRIPREELDRSDFDSEEEYIEEALELAPDYQLAMERDVPLKIESKTILLDQWPEKQFCHPETSPGECSIGLNYCPLQCEGTLEDTLAELLGLIEMLFDGWHLALDEECHSRYSYQTHRAIWSSELEEQECREQLENEAADKE